MAKMCASRSESSAKGRAKIGCQTPALVLQSAGRLVKQGKLAGVGADHETVTMDERFVGVAGGVEEPVLRTGLCIQAIDAVAAIVLVPARAAGRQIKLSVLDLDVVAPMQASHESTPADCRPHDRAGVFWARERARIFGRGLGFERRERRTDALGGMIDPGKRVERHAVRAKGRNVARILQERNDGKLAPPGGMQRQAKFGLHIALLGDRGGRKNQQQRIGLAQPLLDPQGQILPRQNPLEREGLRRPVHPGGNAVLPQRCKDLARKGMVFLCVANKDGFGDGWLRHAALTRIGEGCSLPFLEN